MKPPRFLGALPATCRNCGEVYYWTANTRMCPVCFGRKSKGKGKESEERVEVLLVCPERPAWVVSARRATKLEDHNGVDFMVLTDAGPIPLQVKSSREGVARHRGKARKLGRPPIPCVFVNGTTSKILADRIWDVVGQERAARLGIAP